jgi:peptidyl-prolyl cis-trans isomerase C
MLESTICRFAGALTLASVLSMAQTPATLPAPGAKPIGPNDVVATVEGEKMTPARIQQLRDSLPAQFQQTASRMDNKAFLKSYGELVALFKLAEKEKLADQEPFKGQLDFLRMNFLAQSYIEHLSRTIDVSQQDFLNYYNEHKADYEEATVRAIYIAFSTTPSAPSSAASGKKPLTEDQAKAKAEALVKQLRNGGDFAKLAQENSDDAATAQKGGELGVIKKSATGVPAELRQVIFGLKAGEVSDPVRQPAGFYIFKAENVRTIPFEEAAVSMAPAVRGAKVRAELDKVLKSVQVSYDNESFFDGSAGVVAPPKPGSSSAPGGSSTPGATTQPKK